MYYDNLMFYLNKALEYKNCELKIGEGYGLKSFYIIDKNTNEVMPFSKFIQSDDIPYKRILNEYYFYEMGLREQSAYKIAKEMLKRNEPLDKIISYTGLTEDVVKKLINELKNEKGD